jgi:hypothetical protein
MRATGCEQGGETSVIVRQLRFLALAAMVGVATVGAFLWSVTAGSAVASASTRLRSGTVHAQLASHVSHAVPAGLQIEGSGVMAAIVGVLAVSSVAFLIVTFVRRRITVA